MSNINNLSIFDFSSNEIRVFPKDGEAWFVAADMCEALELSNPSMALEALDNDEKMTLSLSEGQKKGRGGAQSYNVVNESGMYHLVFKSRKKAAKKFRKWVTSEVLPSIRKTGTYSTPETEATNVFLKEIKLNEKLGLSKRQSIIVAQRETLKATGIDKCKNINIDEMFPPFYKSLTSLQDSILKASGRNPWRARGMDAYDISKVLRVASKKEMIEVEQECEALVSMGLMEGDYPTGADGKPATYFDGSPVCYYRPLAIK